MLIYIHCSWQMNLTLIALFYLDFICVFNLEYRRKYRRRKFPFANQHHLWVCMHLSIHPPILKPCILKSLLFSIQMIFSIRLPMTLWGSETHRSYRQNCRFHCRTRAASRAFHWMVWRQTRQSWSSLASRGPVLRIVPLAQTVHLRLIEPGYSQISVTAITLHSICWLQNSDVPNNKNVNLVFM